MNFLNSTLDKIVKALELIIHSNMRMDEEELAIFNNLSKHGMKEGSHPTDAKLDAYKTILDRRDLLSFKRDKNL